MDLFNSEKIKLDFPIFKNEYDFGELIYLDNAATTQKPEQVIECIKDFYQNHNANVHRSIYDLAESSTAFYEKSRETIAKFINAQPEEIVFTKGTTDGINFVATAWASKFISVDDQIVLTQAEHHANLLPWQRVAKEKGAVLKFIKLNTKTFKLDLSNLDEIINSKTKLVAIIHSSNVLGDVWDNQLQKVIRQAHSVGAKVLLDSAQTVCRQKIDVKKLNPDFLVFSGHKMLGPTGIGVLFIKKELHEQVDPYQLGGSMVDFVSFNEFKCRKAPHKFEAGTPPIAQAIGLSSAVDYLNKRIDFDKLKKHEACLCSALIDGLQKIEEIQILGDISYLKKSGHLVCFTVKGLHVHDVGALLSNKGIAVRSGHHCAQPLARLLNINGSLRVSFYIYNSEQDIQKFLETLKNAIKFFRG